MDPAARVEQRLARLKADIKPTQQEPLWQAFAEKSKAEATKGLQGNARAHASRQADGRAGAHGADAGGDEGQRWRRWRGVNESFKRLYAALSPEQKAAADKQFGAMGAPGHAKDMVGPGRGGPRWSRRRPGSHKR
jgi:hypothetical protein